MKRYLLFMYQAYYPGGGWEDFHGEYNTVQEAKDEYNRVQGKIHPISKDLYDIIDTETMENIA